MKMRVLSKDGSSSLFAISCSLYLYGYVKKNIHSFRELGFFKGLQNTVVITVWLKIKNKKYLVCFFFTNMIHIVSLIIA